MLGHSGTAFLCGTFALSSHWTVSSLAMSQIIRPDTWCQPSPTWEGLPPLGRADPPGPVVPYYLTLAEGANLRPCCPR